MGQMTERKFQMIAGIASAIIVWGTVVHVAVSLSEPYGLTMDKLPLRGLRPGWFMGRAVDCSDMQWRDWRGNLPILTVGMAIFLIGSKLTKSIFSVNKKTNNQSNQSYNNNHQMIGKENINNYINESDHKRVLPLVTYYIIFALIFLYVLHRNTFIYPILIAFISYSIAAYFKGSKWNPILTWAFNVIILFTSYFYDGYSLSPWLVSEESWLSAVIDRSPVMLRWQTYFKISMLRLISYNFDYYWSLRNSPPVIKEGSTEYTRRVMGNLPEGFYSFKYFFAYVFYVPLYLAGPITSFNSFVSHLGTEQQTYSRKEIALKAVWMFALTITIDIFLHYIYIYSFTVSGHWKDLTYAYESAVLGFWTLQFMFLKFLVFWRFFRITALIDGIEAPENMHRCMNNNDTFTGFWRSWHASFNKWIIRYIYVPLGGSKTQKMTLLPIFLFIGLWHDLWMRWVAWAMLNSFFFMIEILILTSWHKHSFWKPIKKQWWCDYALGVAGAWNSVFILITNLAINLGFADTFEYIQYTFLGYKDGYWSVIFWVTFFFSFGSLLDYKLRDIETELQIQQKF